MNQTVQAKDLQKLSKEVSTRPYFVKTAYYNRLKMLDYKMFDLEADWQYITRCIEGITESTYRDIYGTVYIPDDKRELPHKKAENARNFKMISNAINQFAFMSGKERKEYLESVVPRVEVSRKVQTLTVANQRQRS